MLFIKLFIIQIFIKFINFLYKKNFFNKIEEINFMKIVDNTKFKKILFSLTRFCERLDLNVSELYQVFFLIFI